MKSQFLESRKTAAKELVMSLKKYFSYVSILGTDVRCQSVASTTRTSSISDEGLGSECGFVLKMKNNKGFFEYSLDDISGDINKLANDIIDTPATMAVKSHLRNNLPVVIAVSTNNALSR